MYSGNPSERKSDSIIILCRKEQGSKVQKLSREMLRLMDTRRSICRGNIAGTEKFIGKILFPMVS